MADKLTTYNEALGKYNVATEEEKAGLWEGVKAAYDALSDDEKKTANPLPAELAPAAPAPTGSMGGRKSSRKSGGSRANKRGGKRASKRGGSRASKRGGKRGGSRSSRR